MIVAQASDMRETENVARKTAWKLPKVMVGNLIREDSNTTTVKIAGHGQLYRERYPTMRGPTGTKG